MIAGFGNLRGDVECWRVGDNKNEKNEKISEAQRGDTTFFEWAPGNLTKLKVLLRLFRTNVPLELLEREKVKVGTTYSRVLQ